VSVDFNCQSVVNPVLDVSKFLSDDRAGDNYSHYQDRALDRIYDELVREADQTKLKALMHQYEKRGLDEQAHYLMTLWRTRLVPYNVRMHGWKISPSHSINQDLGIGQATIPRARCDPPPGSPPMTRYVFRRFLMIFPTLFGVAVLVFVLMRLLPGDIVEVRFAAEGGTVSQDVLQQECARLGLDRPMWLQFVDWMAGLTRLDLGRSMWTGDTVAHEIAIRAQPSLEVAVIATIVAVTLAIPLGVLAALAQDTCIDYLVRMFSIAGRATPSFWLGILILLAFLIIFHWTIRRDI
jgi:binding-protein-dependent transport system inner membrane component